MQTGLRAISWGLQRVVVALGILAVCVVMGYVIWVTAIVAGMALSGQ